MTMGFNDEVACIEKPHLGFCIVALECFSSGWNKIILAPDRQGRRLVAAEELAQLTVLLDILL